MQIDRRPARRRFRHPAARKARIEAALLDEADVEHASAKDLIGKSGSGNPSDDRYDAKVCVGEHITHHVVEEHTEMFPNCRRSTRWPRAAGWKCTKPN